LIRGHLGKKEKGEITMSDKSDSIDNPDDTEMMISNTGASTMAAGGSDNGSPVDEDGTDDADGGFEGGAEALSDGVLATPISDHLESDGRASGGGS
jgi:hypothetical protein